MLVSRKICAIIVPLVFLFYFSIPVWAKVDSVRWEDLSEHLAQESIPLLELNVNDCPNDIENLEPSRVIAQIIENTFYLWEEYDILTEDGIDTLCIVMKKPNPGPLSKKESQVLLTASSRWIESQPRPEDAIILDASDPRLNLRPIENLNKDKSFLPENIIGDDDRERITDTTTYPWETYCYLELYFPFGAYQGTGCLVSPYMVLTCGHNVYNQDYYTYVDSVTIAPSQKQYYEGGPVTKPYGTREGVEFQTNSSYLGGGSYEHDYGAVFFCSPFSGISTFMPVQFSSSSPSVGDTVCIAGYPAEAQGESTSALWNDCDIVHTYTTSTILRYTVDTSGGQSGSPVCGRRWVTDPGIIVAVHAFGNSTANGGPRLRPNNKTLIEEWMEWTPPCSIIVTSPTSSSSWECGNCYYITWNSECNPGDVKIELYKGDSKVRTIDYGDTDDGSYRWCVPEDIVPGCDYRVKITSTEDSSCYDNSDYFCITCDDISPPSPNPMTWATEPYATNTFSICMVATAATDETPPILYYFDFISSPTGGTGGTDSSWQSSTTYCDSGLSTNHKYCYQVKAKDDNNNETSYSSLRCAWTLPADPYVSCDCNIGNPAWPVDTVFTFTNEAGFGGGGVDYYLYAWDQNEIYIFNGSEPNWPEGSLELVGNATCKWYLHLLSYNGNDDVGGTADFGPYHVLDEPNMHPEPNMTPGLCNTIYWDPIADGNEYYAECANDVNFTNIDANSGWTADTSYEFRGLTAGQTYYYRVKARTGPKIETWLQTSQTDFETDTLMDTVTTGDGDVILSGGSGTPVVDTVGSTSSDITSAGYLNCFLITTETILTQIEVYLDISTSVSIEFVVYEGGPSYSDSYNRIHSSTLAGSGTGTKFYSSNPISVPLEAGKHYLIGAVYSGSVAIYYNGCSEHSSPSFGSHIGYASCTFPSPSTRTAVSSNCTFHHRYTTAQATGGYDSPGDIVSIVIDLPADGNWAVVDFNTTTPADTELTVDILPTADTTPIPGYENVSGGADLSGIGDSNIRIRANLSTADTNNTPILHNWSVSYTDPALTCESDWSNEVNSTQELPGGPNVIRWEIGATHGGSVGEIWCEVDVNDYYVEPRTCAIAKLRVCFDTPMDISVTDPNVISIEGVNGGIQPPPCLIEWVDSNYCMVITLCSVLQNEDTYTITLKDAIKSEQGVAIEETSICLTELKGDANGNRSVNSGDLLAIRSHINQAVDCNNARYDINLSGLINSGDLLAARSFIPSSAPACP